MKQIIQIQTEALEERTLKIVEVAAWKWFYALQWFWKQ